MAGAGAAPERAPAAGPRDAELAARPPEERPDADRTAQRASAPLRVVRAGDRVRIQTRGALDDVVPALIDSLNDPDDAVARAVEQHLEALRAELAGDAFLTPLAHSDPRDDVDRPGGLRGLLTAQGDAEEAAAAPDAYTRWSNWWLGRSTSPADTETF